MQTFGYSEPSTVAKAAGAASANSEGRYLAGGQSLLAAMKLGLAAPGELIDLSRVADLRGIKVEGNGAAITVGAMATHAEVAASLEVGARIPALAALAGGIGDAQVRNRGTLGGSLANDDPAADYPAAVLALGGTVNTNKRQIAADDFFKGLFETALAPGELILSVTFPVPKRAAYQKFRNPASRFALVGVFAAQTSQGARVAVTGAGSRGVFRVKSMEQALAREWSPKAIESVAVPASELQSDLHASAEYRAQLVNVLARRAVAAAA
ncbi:MAG TPA: xanthine dehydrogenase family protein subunit M [Usitatibacter sp.]|nr:xanthine dehydrogenase family protein subunit M [Usitatibacter sp.]